MVCTYPLSSLDMPARAKPENEQRPAPIRILPQPSIFTNAPLQLTYTDLRFLHHFLTIAYPHLPAGNESIWTDEIPQIAETRPYLMHALLGLGGTHLAMMSTTPMDSLAAIAQPTPSSNLRSSTTTPEHSTPCASSSIVSAQTHTQIANRALHHRSVALSGLNHAITANDWSQNSVDAMLATTYALTFQATYLPHDGLVDFMTMVRGCALITGKIEENAAKSTFALDPLAHVKVLEGEFVVQEIMGGMGVGRSSMDIVGMYDEECWIEEGLRVLESARKVCRDDITALSEESRTTGVLERNLDALIHTLKGFRISTRETYIRYAEIYTVWWQCSSAEFEALTDLFVQAPASTKEPVSRAGASTGSTRETNSESSHAKAGTGSKAASAILALYFLALDSLLTPIFAGLYGNRKGAQEALDRRALITVGWMRGLEARLAGRLDAEELVAWPMSIAARAEREALGRLRMLELDGGGGV